MSPSLVSGRTVPGWERSIFRAVNDLPEFLYRPGQLVCERALPAGAAGVVLTPAEKDVQPGRERLRLKRPAEPVCLDIGVQAHPGEIRVERALERLMVLDAVLFCT